MRNCVCRSAERPAIRVIALEKISSMLMGAIALTLLLAAPSPHGALNHPGYAATQGQSAFEQCAEQAVRERPDLRPAVAIDFLCNADDADLVIQAVTGRSVIATRLLLDRHDILDQWWQQYRLRRPGYVSPSSASTSGTQPGSGPSTLSPTPQPSRLSSACGVGARAQVGGTDGVGLAVRVQPSLSADMLSVLADGSTVETMSAPRTAEGEQWCLARYNSQGDEGWVRAQYLMAPSALARSAPTPTATAQVSRMPGAMIGSREAERDRILSDLFDPCTTIQWHLREQGINPFAARESPFHSFLFRSTYPLLLPVLHRIALDPSLAQSASQIAALIRYQIDGSLSGEPVLYTYHGGLQALSDIEDTIQRGAAAY